MIAELRAAGIPAHGDVFEGGPVAAVQDVLALEDIDELIVSTHPEEKSGWLRKKNVLAELRRLAGDRPVPARRLRRRGRTGRANVLVVANETVLGERASRPHPGARGAGPGRVPDRLARRATRVRPSIPRPSGGSGRRSRRSATRASRRTGRSPTRIPYAAAMQVIEDERVDEVIVSTFPGERSGWLRRDVVERLRKDAGVPVEHVVADVPAVTGGIAS